MTGNKSESHNREHRSSYYDFKPTPRAKSKAGGFLSCPSPRRARHLFFILCCLGLIGFPATACDHARHSSTAPSRDGWHEFQGTWTAAGSRHTMELGGERRASVLIVNGSLVLSGESRPSVGFRSEAIVFNDNATGMVGRAVWTDEKGEQVFSELQGEGTASHNKITGTFVGGTGRYSGATGTYDFSWRFLLADEEGNVQGQSVGLTGRVRVDRQRLGSAEGAPHP